MLKDITDENISNIKFNYNEQHNSIELNIRMEPSLTNEMWLLIGPGDIKKPEELPFIYWTSYPGQLTPNIPLKNVQIKDKKLEDLIKDPQFAELKLKRINIEGRVDYEILHNDEKVGLLSKDINNDPGLITVKGT